MPPKTPFRPATTGRAMPTTAPSDPAGMDEALLAVDHPCGNFLDATDAFAPLFGDPDARGGRKWSEVFNPANAREIDPREILEELPKL